MQPLLRRKSALSRPRKRHRQMCHLAQIAPPTPSTCSAATQRSIQLLAPSARWTRVLRAPPHRSWSLQRLCSGKNRKPFRAPPTARASRPDTARRPSQRSPPCLQPATPQPTRHASTPCPCRLPCAPVPAVDPLLRPLLVAGATRWSPRKPEKHESWRSEFVVWQRWVRSRELIGHSPQTCSGRK